MSIAHFTTLFAGRLRNRHALAGPPAEGGGLRFGAHMPGERLGRYRLGDDVAVAPEDGGAISAADYALGFVDLIEKGDHHRAQVNLSH
jgi:hypothetical protein